MKAIQWLRRETKAFALLFIYFCVYFGIFIVLKKLILAHYDISFYGLGAAVVGALIAAKAFLVIESLPLPRFLSASSPFLRAGYQAVICTFLALIFLYLEESLKLIKTEGTFRLAFFRARHESDVYEFWARVGWAGFSFLHYAVLVEIGRHFRPGGLMRMLFTPSPAVIEDAQVSH